MATASNTQWKSREDFKKSKDLEEARKAGTAPAEVDEDGKDINPHIPQYIMKIPWYYDNQQPTLKHQKQPSTDTDKKGNKFGVWYNKGATLGESANKYRKGACENCGAMTHKTKDCCERPRKVGAKFNSKDIKPDELVETIDMSYDAKRDPYNGYNPESYGEVMALYEKADQERKKKKLDDLKKQYADSKQATTTEELEQKIQEEEELDTYDAENIAPIQKMDPKSRSTIRNLRIREDTAKYLYNLDLDSAFYEPKSRSMRDNPLPNSKEDVGFIGDNFTRTSGDIQNFRDMQLFAWEAHDKGQDVDASSAPTQAALLHKDFLAKKNQLKEQSKKIILGKYGGEEHLIGKDSEMDGKDSKDVDIVPSSELYTEYSATGKLIKGEEIIIKSKYEEDVYINNHTSVWGSFWENGQWGYQCCKQCIKNTFCTGETGRKLKEQPNLFYKAQQNNINEQEEEELLLKEKEANDKKHVDKKSKSLKKAIKAQEELNRKDLKDFDERKSKYNSLNQNHDVSNEDIEAYSLKRKRVDDPMSNYVDEDD